MSNIFKKSELDKLDKIVLKNGTTKNINSVIFPHTLKVGMNDNSHYNATISGSIHHTHEGKSYLVAGNNITITSSSSGQVRISAPVAGGITAVTAGTGLSGGGSSSAVTLSTNDSEIVHDSLSGFVANEHIDHSSVSITSGNGLTGGGDITTSRTIAVGAGTGINVNANDVEFDADGGTLTTSNSDLDHFLINDGGVFKRITPSNVNISGFNNDSGYTTTAGTVTNVTVGTGLDVFNGTVTPNISLDLSELTTSTDDGHGDHFIVVDTANQQRKLTKGNINLSGFNNDSGFVTENTMGAGFVLEDGDGTEVTITENKEVKFVEGTGIEINWTDTSPGSDADPYDLNFSVDVSDFMSNGSNNRIVTATGTDAMNAEANLTFDGSDLTVTGRVIPGADDTYDLGSTTAAWKDLHLEGDIKFTDAAEIDVASGDLIFDVDGNITLNADGGLIYMKDGGGTRLTFNLDTTPEIDVAGSFTVDCTGDITLDADGGQVFFKDNGSTYLTFNVNGTTDSIQASGDLTLDASGDITLSADGDQIIMDDGQGNDRFIFNLDNTPELDINGSFTIDCGGDIVIDAGGGQIDFKDGGVSRLSYNIEGTSSDPIGIETAGAFAVTGSGFIFNATDTHVPQLYMRHQNTTRLTFNLDSSPDITASGDFKIESTGDITLEPTGPVKIKQSSDSTGVSGLYLIESTDANDIWNIYRSATRLNFARATDGSSFSTLAYLHGSSNVAQLDFTGQHRSSGDENLFVAENIGKIVAAKGTFNNLNDSNFPSIDEALPVVELTNKQNQKNVYGVISTFETSGSNTRSYDVGTFSSLYEKDASDRRIIVNSVGEGAIWITNVNGNLENGDYITTSKLAGYGMRQDDDILHNYTVAKITQDCDFNLSGSNYNCEELVFSGSTYRKAFVGCTYHCG